jgi:hypothetical protein
VVHCAIDSKEKRPAGHRCIDHRCGGESTIMAYSQAQSAAASGNPAGDCASHDQKDRQ